MPVQRPVRRGRPPGRAGPVNLHRHLALGEFEGLTRSRHAREAQLQVSQPFGVVGLDRHLHGLVGRGEGEIPAGLLDANPRGTIRHDVDEHHPRVLGHTGAWRQQQAPRRSTPAVSTRSHTVRRHHDVSGREPAAGSSIQASGRRCEDLETQPASRDHRHLFGVLERLWRPPQVRRRRHDGRQPREGGGRRR